MWLDEVTVEKSSVSQSRFNLCVLLVWWSHVSSSQCVGVRGDGTPVESSHWWTTSYKTTTPSGRVSVVVPACCFSHSPRLSLSTCVSETIKISDYARQRISSEIRQPIVSIQQKLGESYQMWGLFLQYIKNTDLLVIYSVFMGAVALRSVRSFSLFIYLFLIISLFIFFSFYLLHLLSIILFYTFLSFFFLYVRTTVGWERRRVVL